MKRREFRLATPALLVSSRRSSAQGGRRRLGFLAIGDGSGQALNPAERVFLEGLRTLGWTEGRNLVVSIVFSHPPDRLEA